MRIKFSIFYINVIWNVYSSEFQIWSSLWYYGIIEPIRNNCWYSLSKVYNEFKTLQYLLSLVIDINIALCLIYINPYEKNKLPHVHTCSKVAACKWHVYTELIDKCRENKYYYGMMQCRCANVYTAVLYNIDSRPFIYLHFKI